MVMAPQAKTVAFGICCRQPAITPPGRTLTLAWFELREADRAHRGDGMKKRRHRGADRGARGGRTAGRARGSSQSVIRRVGVSAGARSDPQFSTIDLPASTKPRRCEPIDKVNGGSSRRGAGYRGSCCRLASACRPLGVAGDALSASVPTVPNRPTVSARDRWVSPRRRRREHSGRLGSAQRERHQPAIVFGPHSSTWAELATGRRRGTTVAIEQQSGHHRRRRATPA